MVMRVKVGGQRDHDRATEPAIDVVGDNSLQNGSLKDPVQAAVVSIKVVGRQGRVFSINLRWSIFRLSCSSAGHVSGGRARWGDHRAGRGRRARTLKVDRQRVAVDGIPLLFLF